MTSTLSSQAPPAVGRALGAQLASQLKIENAPISPRAVSYVSLGDGSVNNAHFLAALNLAEYASHRGFKCPTLFGITDNQISISLRGYDWLPKFVEQRIGMKVFQADGTDIVDSFCAATEATQFVRKKRKPAVAVFSNLPRKFGHAATDRQNAYLTTPEIENARNHDPLSKMCAHAVHSGALSLSQLETRFAELKDVVERAFDRASEEPKITSRDEIVKRVSQPIRAVTSSSSNDEDEKPPEVMRKHMTRLMHEVMEQTNDVVYLGEDVRHGGYYLVTDKLYEKFPHRIHDFPPDETTLIGAGMGYAQSGLTPIVEIPYVVFQFLLLAHGISLEIISIEHIFTFSRLRHRPTRRSNTDTPNTWTVVVTCFKKPSSRIG